MVRFDVIAFTHHCIGIDEIGKFHIDKELVAEKMRSLKEEMDLMEIMYLSTCNRVEFILATEDEVNHEFISLFLKAFNPEWDHHTIQGLADRAKYWNGINAVNHLIEVASSVDSMVIGEREIITQVREAYEFSRDHGLSGDIIRVVIRQTIQTAKRVYTETSISTKPVSVVSLAYHHLQTKNINENARFLIIGAGVTNQNMCRFLKKHGYRNFTVFNRTYEKAENLANEIGGRALPLSELQQFKDGFDVIVTCTGSSDPVITGEIYREILGSDNGKKIIIDLAIPPDTDNVVVVENNIDFISVELLKTISEQNLKIRKQELIKVRQIIYEAVEEFKEIFKMRQVEIKMRTIPERVKEIRSKALNEVFSKELSELDDNSKEVLDKILNYMEKKYVSVPMLMAKELIKKEDI